MDLISVDFVLIQEISNKNFLGISGSWSCLGPADLGLFLLLGGLLGTEAWKRGGAPGHPESCSVMSYWEEKTGRYEQAENNDHEEGKLGLYLTSLDWRSRACLARKQYQQSHRHDTCGGGGWGWGAQGVGPAAWGGQDTHWRRWK